MSSRVTTTNVAHPFWPVKSNEYLTFGTPPDSMIHHKVTVSKRGKRILSYSGYVGKPYGVSSSHKVLTKGLLFKKWDLVRTFLRVGCNLTTKEVAVALVLLRLQAYYPQVYPKASQAAQEAHAGIATFWRTVDKLRDMNLLEVVNQFVIRVEAQISNLYLLKNLLIAIAKYLAEHIGHVWPDWLNPYIDMTWPKFWSELAQSQEARAGP